MPSLGVAPSEITTIDASRLPSVCRWRIASHTASTSKGSSGMSVMVAPPAMPAHAAM